MEVLSASEETLPDHLVIQDSNLPHVERGVFTTTDLSPGMVFGPYWGRHLKKDELTKDMDTTYMWEITTDGVFTHVVDGADKECSNWLRYVNCARYEAEQNLDAFQEGDRVFYRVRKEISAGEELLVWYSYEYGKALGILESKDNNNNVVSLEECSPDEINSNDGCSCPKCHRVFTCPRFLALHLKHVCPDASIGKHRCPQCDKGYSSHLKLEAHIRKHTGERPFKCELCDKTFKMSHHLRTHTRTHTGERPYQCSTCGKCFVQSSSLRIHEQRHMGEKRYQCEICGKTFLTSGSHQVHLRVHSGEKPYTCSLCNAKFSQASSLNRHKLTHSGIRPHSCEICGRTFTQTNSLQRHMLLHTGEKPYTCSHCGNRFRQSASLTKHLLTHKKDGHPEGRCSKRDSNMNNSL